LKSTKERRKEQVPYSLDRIGTDGVKKPKDIK